MWTLLNRHARSGLDGSLRLEAMRAECDRTADPVGVFEKIVLLEDVLRRED